jgi:hypothetical protein
MGLNTTSLHENKCSGEGRDVIRRVEATLGCSSTNGGWWPLARRSDVHPSATAAFLPVSIDEKRSVPFPAVFASYSAALARLVNRSNESSCTATQIQRWRQCRPIDG